jgi:very-short-patch-repair endonuclease
MSNLADIVEDLILKSFPMYKYKREKYIKHQNTQLFFDFILPELKLLIEVQGQQHYTYNKLYHKSKEDLQSQKYRDTLKTQWAAENGYKLLCIPYSDIDKLDEDTFKELVVNFL